ncbi:MAG TPA: hypothetical protein VMT17_04990 [Anaeromyxobacteraceae bacterium]|nr:hypothetical protein [Anaeromyxobacteraceae bacterium]
MAAVQDPQPLDESEAERLREEHDRLARAVATRTSIDDVRRGAYASFLCVVSAGLAAKFAWDRWGWGPHRAPIRFRIPLLFFSALVLALASGAVAAWAFRRARRLMRAEDRDFARLRELRGRLGIEP